MKPKIMKRTTIFLTDEQAERLSELATRKAIKPAQLIRMYINAGIAREKK
jgi:predicted DNA-binding protein